MRQATTHRLVEDEELAVPVPGRFLMVPCTMLSMRYVVRREYISQVKVLA